MLFLCFGAEGFQQQLNDATHYGWLGPGRADGRLKLARCVQATALEVGQQQLKDANHEEWLEPGRWPAAAKKCESRWMARARACWGRGVGGEGAWSGGRGLMIDNPRQAKQFHTPCYNV